MNSNDAHRAQPLSGPIIVEKELSHAIVGCFYEVYNELGYGFVESLYARALEITLRGRGLRVDREYPSIVTLGGRRATRGRLDSG